MNGHCEPPLNISAPGGLVGGALGRICFSALILLPRPCNALERLVGSPKTAISPFPPSPTPARELAGFGGVGQVDSSRNSSRSAGRKGPAIAELVLRASNKKSPGGVMAWEAFMARPWGLAGLNVEKDRHEKLWQTLTFRARC